MHPSYFFLFAFLLFHSNAFAQTDAETATLKAWASAYPDLGWAGDDVTKYEGLTFENGTLTRLDVAYRRLGGPLPANIGALTNLKMLLLNGCSLSELPAEIAQCVQLRILDVSNNDLRQMPEALTTIKSLVVLRIGQNKLTALPEALGGLTNLTELRLQANQLTALPASLGNLKKLETLYLHENQMETLSLPLAQLTQLQECTLQNNFFLPAAVKEFKSMGLPVTVEPQRAKPEVKK